jgi:hypothetical protein
LKSTQQQHWLIIGLAVFSAVVSYGTALQAPLFFDDISNLVQNSLLDIDGRVFDGWRTAAFSSEAGPLRRPISMLSFAANHALAGEFSPVSLKLVNLTIHLLTAVCIYWLALGVFRAPVLPSLKNTEIKLAALVAAAIWLLHPLHVSTVLYTVQRMAQLSTFFTVLGLCVFMHYRLRWVHRGAPVGEMLAAGLWLAMITVIATLSKENGALLPWLVMVVEVTLFQGWWNGEQHRFSLCLGWVAFLLPVLLIALILLFVPETFTAGFEQRNFSMMERLMTQGRLLWQYLSWLCLPDITAMGFHHDDIVVSKNLVQPMTTLLGLMAWLAVLVLAFLTRARYPLLLFALLFFLVAHVMESTFLALEMAYEHRNYLPSIGMCLFTAYLLILAGVRTRQVRTWLTLVGVLGILSLLLFLRTQVWSSQFSLAQANVANHPTSVRAQYYAGTAFLAEYKHTREGGASEEESKGLMIEARHHYLRMHEEAPRDVLALVTLMYVDSYFFPGLGPQMRWFEKLEEALENKILQAGDLAALSLFLDCVSEGGCDVAHENAAMLLDHLVDHTLRKTELLLLKYNFLVAIGAPTEQRLEPLNRAAKISPHHSSVQYYRVIESSQRQDVAKMYEIVRVWLDHDTNRWRLQTIKSLFTSPVLEAMPADKIEIELDSEK